MRSGSRAPSLAAPAPSGLSSDVQGTSNIHSGGAGFGPRSGSHPRAQSQSACFPLTSYSLSLLPHARSHPAQISSLAVWSEGAF